MVTIKVTDNKKLITATIQQLEPALAEIFEAFRQIILNTDAVIG